MSYGHVLATIFLVVYCIAVHGELTCKGVEYSYNVAGLYSFSTAQPIDVCHGGSTTTGNTTFGYGYWYYCSADGDVWLATYATPDCSGTPASQQEMANYYAAYASLGFTMTAYCNLPACEYVTVKSSVSVITDCEADTDPLSSYSSVAMVANHCSELDTATAAAFPDYSTGGGVNFQCSNGVGVLAYYSDAECSGDPTTTQTIDSSASFTCEQGLGAGVSYAVSIECGTATFAGLLNDQNSDNANPVQSGACHVCLLHVYFSVIAVLSIILV